MVAHTYNLSTWKSETDVPQVEGQCGLSVRLAKEKNKEKNRVVSVFIAGC